MANQFSLVWDRVNFIREEPLSKRLLLGLTCGIYSKPGRERPTLLNSNGVIRQGELVALMGPSGAGKTTLLKSLAFGESHPGFEGTVFVKGLEEATPVRARNINQCVKEHLIDTLTVSESLLYASQLKNQNVTEEQHEAFVEQCMVFLQLNDVKIKDTLVRDCSGGTIKRLAVGLELIAVEKPHFLFLDEPTSGLDSHIGESLIQLLADCARTHQMTIVTAIHQPMRSVFELFSRVFIMAKDGRIIYNMKPRNLETYLEESGYLMDPNTLKSPSDIAMEIAFRYKEPAMAPICEAMINRAAEETLANLVLDNANVESRIMQTGVCSVEARFSIRNFLILLRRTIYITSKQGRFIFVRFLLHAVMVGVLMTLFDREIGRGSGCCPKDMDGALNCTWTRMSRNNTESDLVSSNVKFQFFSMLFLMFASLMPTVLTFPSEIKLFLNEYRNGFYSTTTYYLTKTFVEIPLQLLFPYMYCCFIYWYFQQPDGMNDWSWLYVMSDRFGLFFFTTALCCFIAQGLGFLIGIICVSSFNISIIVSSSTILFLSLYSGFFVIRNDMGYFATGASYTSFISFGFESIIISLFGRGRCGPHNESTVIKMFSFEHDNGSLNYWVLWSYFIGVRLLAFYLLKLKVSRPLFSDLKKLMIKGQLERHRVAQLNEGMDSSDDEPGPSVAITDPIIRSGAREKERSCEAASAVVIKTILWTSLRVCMVQLVVAGMLRIVYDIIW